MTALTLYGSNVASGTLATADQLPITTGGAEVNNVTTAPASAQGYMEVLSQGGSGTVSASLPAPSGKGWLYDSTALEGQTIPAGSWSAVIAVADTLGSGPVTSMVFRAYKRSSGGAYTAIGTLTLSSPTLNTSRTTYTLTSGSFSSMSFATGDKLYVDVFLQATGISAWTSDTIAVYISNSSLQGVANDLQIATPGYAASSTLTITDAGLNLARDGDSGANTPLIKYVAFGSSTTAPTTTDTKLGAETFRKAVTSYTNGATGEIFVNMYLAPGEAIGDDIEEVGFFGGNTATSTANTGVLYAHGLYSHPSKTAQESIQFQLDNTHARG